MRRTFGMFVVAFAITGALSAGTTCAAPDLAPGARIRWLAAGGTATLVVGRAVSLRSDTLFASSDLDSSRHVLPLVSLATLEISEGRPSRAPEFAWKGAVTGGAAAVGGAWIFSQLVGKALGDLLGRDTVSDDNSVYLPAALIGASVGAACGAAIGATWHGSERWTRVNARGRQFDVLLTPGGAITVGLLARF